MSGHDRSKDPARSAFDRHEILVQADMPFWLPRDVLFGTLLWIDAHPSAWMYGLAVPYIELRLDSRTGSGYLYTVQDTGGCGECPETYYTVHPDKYAEVLTYFQKVRS